MKPMLLLLLLAGIFRSGNSIFPAAKVHSAFLNSCALKSAAAAAAADAVDRRMQNRRPVCWFAFLLFFFFFFFFFFAGRLY